MTTTRATRPARPADRPARPDRIDPAGPSALVVAQAWLGSRLIVLLLAVTLAMAQGQTLTRVLDNWDADLYGKIARDGYLAHENSMAFFPGLPALMSAGLQLGAPTAITGLVVSGIGSALAAAALTRLANSWVALAWLFAPTAVFTVVPYTESLFCAAAFWAWERARSDRWAAAAVLAGVAAAVRVSGIFLIIALAVLAVTTLRRWPDRARALAWLVVPGLVVVGYLAYLYALTGDPLAWYHAQKGGWMREFTWPWQSAINTWPVIAPGGYPDQPLWAPVFRLEVVSMVLGVLTTGWCLGRRRWAEAVWVGVQVLAFSTSYWFYSVNRATLLWFPLWIMLVELARWRPRSGIARVLHHVALGAGSAAMGCGLLFWCWLFFTGNWAG